MNEIVIQLLAAVVGSIGFSLIFNVSRKHIIAVIIGSFLSWALYLLSANVLMLNVLPATVISAACCEIYAEILARIMKVPTTIIYIPAVVPLIPGGSLYNTMHAAVYQDWVSCRAYGFQTLQTTLGIAIGISFVSALMHVVANIAKQKATAGD